MSCAMFWGAYTLPLPLFIDCFMAWLFNRQLLRPTENVGGVRGRESHRRKWDGLGRARVRLPEHWNWLVASFLIYEAAFLVKLVYC